MPLQQELFLQPKTISIQENSTMSRAQNLVDKMGYRIIWSYLYLIACSVSQKRCALAALCPELQGSWFKSYGQSNLCAFLYSPCVNFTRNSDERFGAPLVLHESTRFAIVVHSSFQRGQGIQCMLCPNSECVLIGREAVSQLGPNSCVGQWAYCVEVGSCDRFTFVIPVYKPRAKDYHI